jgi:hypothetical protein
MIESAINHEQKPSVEIKKKIGNIMLKNVIEKASFESQ